MVNSEAEADGNSKKAVGFFRAAPETPNAVTLDQEQAFFLFCDRERFQAAATFSANGRPSEGYQSMLRYIRRHGAVDAVVIRSLEVLSASHEDLALRLLELNDLGAKVHLMSGQAVDPYSVVIGSGSQAVEQGTDMRERIKAAMRNRAIKGEGLGKPPYGYKIGRSRKLEVVPDEAETVKRIFSLYTQQDRGIRLIVRNLNENNITTRKGRNWSMVTIRDILRNRTYLGTYTRFGLRVPGSHQAIVTPDMFRWVQSKLEERRPSRKNVQSEPFLLSGLATCGSCGNRMVGVTRRQSWTRRKDGSRAEREYRYYQCQSRTNQGMCDYHTRKAEKLEAGILHVLEEQRPRLAAMKLVQGIPSPAAAQRETRRLEVALDRADARLRKSIRQVNAGKLSLQRFRPLSGDLLRTRRELQLRLDELRDGGNADPAISAGQQAAQAIDTLSNDWDTLDFKEKRGLLQGVVERIDVFDDRFDVNLRPELGDPRATA